MKPATANGRGPFDEFVDSAETVGDIEQTLSDLDQTASDFDQTGSDRDQTESDADQTASDRDEAASVIDQEIADREPAGGGDPVEYELNKKLRHRTSAERLIGAAVRDKTGTGRVQVAGERDQMAERREAVRAGNDLTLRDALDGDVFRRADEARAKGAAGRAAAASDRVRAAAEREQAASLRTAAADDRRQALEERKLAGIDQLTGVSVRGVGLGEIEREVERARRTRMPLALAFVDVNRLKAVNDGQGHLVGDGLLKRVAGALRTKLRPYDVIVRFGGDEFVCALANMGSEAVQRRFAAIVETLEASGFADPISYGVADLQDGDDLKRLLARADADLIETRRTSRHSQDTQGSPSETRSTKPAAKNGTQIAQHLRILIANQREDRLERLAKVVTSLGHEVIAREIHVGDVAAETARLRPDVALVGLGESSTHALQMIGEIVRGSYCPVISLLWEYDADWISVAAERGVYAYIVDTRPEELQSAIDITLRRFVEFQEMQGAFERSNAERAREVQTALAERAQMLELHEGVVQALAVAKLELDLNQFKASRESLLGAFEKARAIVTTSLEELGGDGTPLTELLGDPVPTQE